MFLEYRVKVLLREIQDAQEPVHGCRAPAVVSRLQFQRLLAGEAIVANVNAGQVVRATVTTLHILGVVPHPLERALDLFVIVFGWNTFGLLPLPTELPLDDFDLLLRVPTYVAAETH